MRRYLSILTRSAFLLLAAAALVDATSASAQTYTVLYNFGSKANDPSGPAYSGVIAQGRDGNLYTTAPSGGANSAGAVFKITPAGIVTLLYSFDVTHGSDPLGGLTLGTDGNFYGTTDAGGASGGGTIFKITPGGVLTTLYNFTGGADGSNPYAPPIQGSDGNWYGTTNAGGGSSFGTVYKLTTTGTFTSIYSFDGPHGFDPRDPLVLGADGNLYGTTLYGGSTEQGNVFKITNSGAVTVLYDFDNTHGKLPTGAVIQGVDGNFYGTTETGGTAGAGVVFKMTPSGSLTVLHNMNGTSDGLIIYPGLVQASDGSLYGVGGPVSPSNGGTIFKTTTTGTFSVPYSFPADGTKGLNPQVTPVQHTNGILYGDTGGGGTGNVTPCSTGTCGVFYSLNNNLPAFIRLLPYSGRVGSKVGILGQGFSSSSVVKFNGVQATTITLTGTTFIQATVPAGASDGFVTVTTGTATLRSLKPYIVHNSWGKGKAIPTPVAFASAATVGSKLYLFGGYPGDAFSTASTANQIYNPSSNSWTTGAPMPTGLAQTAAAVVNNIAYVFGGTPEGSADSQGVWAYNPATNSWTAKANMPTARRSIAATVENGIIYVIGGYSTAGGRLNTVEAYNPATNTWSTKAHMSIGKSEPSVGTVGSTIISADGYNGSSDDGDNEAYNAGTDTWSSKKADPNPRNGACSGAIGTQLYVAGGSTSSAALSSAESFSLSANAWTTLAPLPGTIEVPASAVYKGQLYCLGGWAVFPNGSLSSGVEVYQP